MAVVAAFLEIKLGENFLRFRSNNLMSPNRLVGLTYVHRHRFRFLATSIKEILFRLENDRSARIIAEKWDCGNGDGLCSVSVVVNTLECGDLSPLSRAALHH